MSSDNNKFEWDATECAPRGYPMEIIRGSFIYQGEKELGLYIPSGGTLKGGWGNPLSSHVTGENYKPLPDRLKITFFSYPEKQFYQGEFDLPYDKILSLFEQGAVENPDNPTISRIMVGIAPGGVVAVWVIGKSGSHEVFFGHADKVELDPGSAFALPFKDKADADKYMHDGLIEAITPDELESINVHGIPFGLWERYRNRYNWIPVVKGGHTRDYINLGLLNAEAEPRWRNFDSHDTDSLRPVPERLSFTSTVNGVNTIFRVHFDEFETMAAFEELGAKGEKLYLEFEPKRPRSQTTVRLYNDEKSIALTKIDSEDW